MWYLWCWLMSESLIRHIHLNLYDRFLGPWHIFHEWFGFYENGHKGLDNFGSVYCHFLSGFAQVCNSHTQSLYTSTQIIKMRRSLTTLHRTSTCNTPASAPSMTIITAEVTPLPRVSLPRLLHRTVTFILKKGEKTTTQQILRNMMFRFSFNLF